MALLNFRAIGHFVDLLIQDHLFKLVSVVSHHLQLYVAELIEIVGGARFLIQRILLEDGQFISEQLFLIACQKLRMVIQI